MAQRNKQAFVDTHNIGCRWCGATRAEWYRTGFSRVFRHWAVCKPCHDLQETPSAAAERWRVEDGSSRWPQRNPTWTLHPPNFDLPTANPWADNEPKEVPDGDR